MTHGVSTSEFPLSPAQLGMWYAQQLDPGVPLYEAQYIEMDGPLDISVLREVSVRAAREFGSGLLRLTERDGRPWQVVAEDVEQRMAYLDLSDAADPDAEALRWMRADVAAPIDLLRDPLGMSALIRVGPQRVLWYSRCHHILLDGFGSASLLYRVADLYNAAVSETETKTAAAMSLSEIHEAEMSYRGSPRFASDAAYWAERTAGMPRRCSLVDAYAPAHALGRTHRITLSDTVVDRLNAAETRFGTGAPALVLAALALYYARLTGRREVVLSLPVSGRTTAMLRRSGGMLANVVPLRISVTDDSTVADIVAAIRVEVSGALRHQRFRHEEMRQDESVGRGFVGPVVNIMLFPAEVNFTGVRTNLHVLTSGPIEDLFVNLYQHGAGAPIHVDFTANPDLYDADSLARHHNRFMLLFESLLGAEAGTPVAALDYFLDEDRRLLAGVPGPVVPSPRLLPEILDAGLRAAGPSAVAVLSGGRTLTYGELDRLSDRLARALLARGAGPETSVLVALPRSVESVVALWGIARSGATYVPVGAGVPVERVARMAAECGARLGITSADAVAELPGAVSWIVPSELLPSKGDVRRAIRPEHPAYAVFTSGSTGVPKGVVVTHAGLAGLVAAVRDAYGAGPGSRVLHCLNPGFDASILELLLAFSSGATLVIAAGDAVADSGLASAIAEFGITQLCSTPAVLATLPSGALDGVRAVSTGGEACPPELVARFGAGRKLVNSYGPSEATIAATFTEGLTPGLVAGIGRPVPGMRLLVLDRLLRPVPVGMPGELYLAGPGLARGYAGRRGPTAERFVANPFGPRGTRMYRTGDLVRWYAAPDGPVLEYLGRTDFQVKLRGMRVEPGEVDIVLAAHPAIEIAVTVPRRTAAGGSALASYVVPVDRDGPGPDLAELTEFCAERLPGHMVPATITVLAALPLTGNGKIDRRALPEPEPVAHEAIRAAGTETERALCALFGELLGSGPVGAESSFFTLGGDSIMAIQLVSRARAAGLVFSARDVFEHPTPAALARVVTAPPTERPVLQEIPGGATGRMPHTPIVAWLLENPTGWEHFSQSMVLGLPIGIDRPRLAQVLQAVIDRHDMLRARLIDGELEVLPVGAVDADKLIHRIDAAVHESASWRYDHAAATEDAAPRSVPEPARDSTAVENAARPPRSELCEGSAIDAVTQFTPERYEDSATVADAARRLGPDQGVNSVEVADVSPGRASERAAGRSRGLGGAQESASDPDECSVIAVDAAVRLAPEPGAASVTDMDAAPGSAPELGRDSTAVEDAARPPRSELCDGSAMDAAPPASERTDDEAAVADAVRRLGSECGEDSAEVADVPPGCAPERRAGSAEAMDGGPAVVVAAAGPSGFELGDDSAMVADAARRLAPASGVMFAVTWVDAGAEAPGRLVLVAHHLVFDAVSWRIVIGDLIAAWGQVAAGVEPLLPAVGTSMRTWAHALSGAALDDSRGTEVGYWADVLAGPAAVLGRRALDPARDLRRDTGRIEVRLPVETMRPLLERMPVAFRAGVEDALLAALAVAVARWRPGMDSALVMVERHGRDEAAVPGADLSRTVGWFTNQFPLRLDLPRMTPGVNYRSRPDTSRAVPDADSGVLQGSLPQLDGASNCAVPQYERAFMTAALKAVKERIREVPRGGIGFGVLRYLNKDAGARLRRVPEFGFNYLGQVPGGGSGPWLPVAVGAELGGLGDADLPAAAVVSLDAVTVETAAGPRLHALWRFASGVIDREDVEELVRQWVSALDAIARLLAEPHAGGLTPSDLPLVAATQARIDEWESRYRGVTDVWPLAPLQRGLLFHAQLAEHRSDGYSVQAVIDLEGEVDLDRMASAARILLRRHDALRTAFHIGDAPVQVVLEEVELPWRCVTADPHDGAALADAELAEPFRLDRPPLIRFLCLRRGAHEVQLVITNHHVVLDGWSMPLLFAELLAIYETGDDSALDTPVSFRRYLEWLAVQDHSAMRAAWFAAMAGLAGPTLVAAARPPAARVPGPDAPALSSDVPLPGPTASALARTAAERGVTLNTVVQVAWALLLAELTGGNDIVFGATVSVRPPEIPHVRRMVGMLVNTIPVRIRLEPAEEIGELLARVSREQGALIAHHALGLNDIQAVAGVGALFDTATVFESYPVDTAALSAATGRAGLRVKEFRGRDGTHYPLSLAAYARDGLRLVLNYSPWLFEDDEAVGLAERLARILARLAADPRQRTRQVRGGAAGDYPGVLRARPEPLRLLPDLLVNGADASGIAVRAVLPGGATVEIGYADLDRRSNQLARLLIAAGAGPESAVLLALPRSAEWFVAVSAIARSGAAFVPVDIADPAGRIADIAAGCGALLGISNTAWQDKLPDTVAWRLLDDPAVRECWEGFAPEAITAAERPPLRAGHPAYIVHTSGSTGAPKGVVVTHAGLSGLVAGLCARTGVGPGDRVLHCLNPNFDASTLVWLTTFATGATLVVAGPDHTVGEAVLETAATQLVATPGMLATVPRADLSGVRVILTGGEAFPPELSARLGAGRALLNSYGPAEATVAATCSAPLAPGDPIGIGAPLPGAGLAVLDPWLRPVPLGALGELYLMGPGLARGYAGQSGPTAERFVANPFGTAGSRMYRTGDVVRRVSHTRLDFLGRNDAQAKVRGIRVEPGEVDAVLRAGPGIAMSATVIRDGAAGGKVLASYVVPAAGAAPTPARVLEYLGARLPRHLVPATVTVLAALPLNANGKVDRRALPEPERTLADYLEPVGAQRAVAAAFGAVLGHERVGAADDFFALGGDSLSATRVAARIGDALGARVPVRLIFDAPTVRELAARIGADAQADGPRRMPRPALVPLSPAQQRMWLINRYDPASGAYNIPVALRLTGSLDIAAMRAALGDVLDRHEALRTVYPDRDGVGHQVILPANSVVPPLDPESINDGDLPTAVLDCVTAGFTVTAEIPVRARLFRLGPDEYVLVLVVHHIAADGFSMGPLAADLMTAYGMRKQGRAPEWRPLPVQYADYTLWQHERLGTTDDPDSLLSAQIRYWRTTLAGLPDQLALPTDRPRPATASLRAGTVAVELDPGLTAAAAALARTGQSTLFMVLHGALAAVLARLAVSTDIALGTPVAGRGAAELDGVVGMFVNTVVLRTEVRPAESFTALLERVRRADLDAFAHSDVPFERLVDVLDPVRSAARHPLVQVMLVFQNLPPVSFELPELRVAAMELDQRAIRFDLSVTVSETDAGLSARFTYATDLFDAETIELLARRWIRLLRAVVRDPGCPVGDIELLESAERSALLAPGAPPIAEPRALPNLLAAAVAANPDGIAITDGTTALTYRELDRRSNRLARTLIRAGAGPERTVALALPRSIESVLAVWAVAKSGAAFVPIDPTYPAERITQILTDSGATLGITNGPAAARLFGEARSSVLDNPGMAGMPSGAAAATGAPLDQVRRPVLDHPDAAEGPSAAGTAAGRLCSETCEPIIGDPRSAKVLLATDDRTLSVSMRWLVLDDLDMVAADGGLSGEMRWPVPNSRDPVEMPVATGLETRSVCWLSTDDADTAAVRSVTDSAIGDDERPPLRPDNPAYLIFTSGSTGRPKGVVVTHAGLANVAALQRERLGTDKSSRIAHLASPSFDASVLELLMAIGPAGTMVIAGPTAYGGAELAELLVRQRVTHLALTPSALASVEPSAVAGGELAAIITGGEECPPDLVARWAAPGRRHFNDYGPTEATIWATGKAMRPGAEITIGMPVPGVTALVLDERLHPVPEGVIGELYLAGIALARGYHGQGGLTATRFVAHPCGAPGERMYRTGDLVRRKRGELHYFGRADSQVKLRGLRIELGEVASALLADPSVEQAVADIYTDPAVGELLVGYVVPAEPDDFAPERLKDRISQRLPSYLVPAAIVSLAAVPRTANGKLDRKALPAPDIRSGRYRAPRTPSQRAVAAIFADLLGIERIGLDDNFFALGGNSLIATRVAARVGAALDIRVPVRTVFDAPTVAALVEAVRDATSPPGPRPGPRQRPQRIPLSAAQHRMWFLNRYDPDSPAHNVPGVFEVIGDLDEEVLRAAIADVLARHESLRTVYPVDDGGEPYQHIVPISEVIVPLQVSTHSMGNALERAMRSAAAGFDLTRELPIRIRLLRPDSGPALLVVVTHHIAADGWSLAPLTRDVMVAWAARRSGAAPRWTPLPLQYADYTLWQRESLGAEDDAGSVAHRQLTYWRAALAGLPDAPTLPTDHPRPAVRSERAGSVDFRISAAGQQRIQELARGYGVSVFMVAHAALAILLSRLSGRDDIAIGTVTAGRGDGELDDLVGMFVGTLVLRTRVDQRATFENLLAATKDSDLDAFGNADLPFERLVELLAPARSTAYHPLFQVLLVLQNFERQPINFAGLELRPVETPTVGAKFELEWMLMEEFDADGAPAGVRGTLIFARDLFEPSTAEAMARRYVEVVEAVTAHPGVAVGALEVTAPPGAFTYEPPEVTVPQANLPYRPPVTTAEHAVVAAFEEVLGAERIGLDDNFFELGGNSMVAIRLVAAVRARTGCHLPVQWIFGDPTPGALARRIAEGGGADPALRPVLPLRRTGAGPALFCIHPAIGLAWGYAGLVRYLDPDHPVYGLQSPGVTTEVAPRRLVERAADYADEIERTQPLGPYCLLGYSAGGPIAHAVAVELQRRGAQVSALIIIDGRADIAPESATEAPSPEYLLAEFGGIDPAALVDDQPADTTLAERAAALLRTTDGPSLTADTLNRLYADYLELVREAADHRPARFTGDLLFFSSTDSTAAGTPNADTWLPYIDGELVDHEIPYEHNKLTAPESFALIGPIVAAYLR
ncbi:non-ribosomal peptide synthetase [Nocardia arthritidis]|uniref:Amino acid adenylation domain-containing protein n=1 Tax=Nocardia arthritidis TaxID=228602 RepID=A0A6G9Y883_9NOCA|nr:non-ribosomal peptide synthetase [Nocardia arthritidis]QIS09297.1 amino acid adenylation domain-containing protein [Nocardia arthritidis]